MKYLSVSNPKPQAFTTQRPAKRRPGLATPQAAAAPGAALRPNKASQAMAGRGFFDFSQLLAASAVPGHLPLYQKMAASLRAAIRSGRLQTGSGVPPERELAVLLGLSRVTARRAIKDSEGRPVELTRSVYRGDRYDYVLDLRASPRGNAPLGTTPGGAQT